jgi:hypothetical protein
MADLGKPLWRQSEDGKSESIWLVTLKYTDRCEENKAKCEQCVTVGVERCDRSGHRSGTRFPRRTRSRSSARRDARGILARRSG